MREAVQLTTLRRYAAQVCRSTWTMSLAVLMAVAVAGCGGSATPSGTTTTTAAPQTVTTLAAPTATSTTSAASATTTLDPQAALQAEAVETVNQFYAAWNDALVTHDSRPLTALALPECESCALIAADIDTIARKNLRVVGGQITLSHVRADPGVDQGIPVQGELVRAAIQLIDASGKVTRSAEEDTAPGMLWILERRDGVLRIREINR
ncbi:MAG TPA: hypothetical protein PLQ23_13100 [Dermatophilaceae bacterium]|nr:hypothetical protein [Dermatophilaceae bacterium]